MALNVRSVAVLLACLGSLPPVSASAQINFAKAGYYLSLGDSLPAGEGALPVTHGFVYQLYDKGAFGPTHEMDFSNIAIKGATADEVLALQVPQALCIQPPRIAVAPSVITVLAGANDFLIYIATNGVPSNPFVTIPTVANAIAAKVETIVRALVFGAANLPAHCARSGIPGVTVLVANYYSFNHPEPQIEFLLDLALESFRASLATRVAAIQADIASSGKTARVGYVDLFSSLSQSPGMLLINRKNGFVGGLTFEIHPTNAGHSAIAREFEHVWRTLP
jgi:lysophospholipase L1-like esterase